jgi:hypothetical protein
MIMFFRPISFSVYLCVASLDFRHQINLLRRDLRSEGLLADAITVDTLENIGKLLEIGT